MPVEDDETKAWALADSLAGTVTTIVSGDSFEMDMKRAEEMILAFAADVRRDERERAARIVDEAAGGKGPLWYPHDDGSESIGGDVLDRLPAAIRALSDAPAATSKCSRCGQSVTNGRGCRDIRCPYSSVAAARALAEAP